MLETFMLKFWGWLLTSVSSVYILRPSICKKVLSMMEDERFVLLSGWFSAILGSLTLAAVTSWNGIALLGTVFMISGFFRIAFPDRFPPVASHFKKRPLIPLAMSFVGFTVGVLFLVKAYFKGAFF